MPESPILTIGIIHEIRPGGGYNVALPNGKIVVGHLPRRLAALEDSLSTGARVVLEMTPYDMEKGRIAGIADDE